MIYLINYIITIKQSVGPKSVVKEAQARVILLAKTKTKTKINK